MTRHDQAHPGRVSVGDGAEPERRDERVPNHHVRAVVVGLLLLLMVAFLPDLGGSRNAPPTIELGHGRIVALAIGDPQSGIGTATVTLLDGERTGQTVEADLEAPGPRGLSIPYRVGDEVIVQISTTPEGELIAVSDYWRVPMLAGLLAAFAALLVLVGGWRGARALIALGLTIGVVLKVLLPLLIAGWEPVPLAVATASGVAVVTMVLTEGLRRTTLAATIGTLAALGLTAVVAAVSTDLARFSLLQGSEEAGYVRSLIGADFDLGGLLLAAVILGALGVLDDVTITQAATVAELAEADPLARRATIVRRAMNVGRSHIAATVNTLFLAYVAVSLPLLLLFAVGAQPAATIASTEFVAVEIVRALVGSIGIVAAVPLTTFVAAWLVPRAPG